MKFLFLFFVFFLLGSCKKNTLKIDETNQSSDKDSFTLYYKNLKKSLNDLQYNEALNYSNKYFTIAQKLRNKDSIAKGYFIKAYTFRKLGEIDSALVNYHISIEAYKNSNDSIEVAKKLLNLANLYQSLGNNTATNETVLEGLNYITDSLEDKFISGLYNAVGNSKKKQQLWDESIYWYEKGLEKIDNADALIVLKNNLGNTFGEKKEYETAFRYFNEAIEIATQLQDTVQKNRAQNNIVYYQWKENPTFNPTTEFLRILNDREKRKDFSGMLSSYDNLSEYYLSTDNSEKAYWYAIKEYEWAKKLENSYFQESALKRLIKSSPPTSTKQYSTQYIRLQDSLEAVKSRAQNTYELIRFDTEKVRREANEMKLENIRKEKENQWYLFLAGLTSLIALLGYFYFQFQKKLTKNKHQKELAQGIQEIEQQNALKVHDELANGAHQIFNLLQNPDWAAHKNSLLHQVEKLYQKSRDLSYEMQSIDPEEDFQTQIIHLVEIYSEGVKVIMKGWENPELQKLSPLDKNYLYRSLQELFVNLQKHSDARLVILKVEKEKNIFIIEYADNGQNVTFEKENFGNGLRNVENRMHSLGGSSTFSAEKGFKATLRFPAT